MSELVVEATGLTKSYGGMPVVRALDFRIERGAVHGLLGPNGSGKSTTVKMLLGLVKPDSGEIRLFGEQLRTDSPQLLRRIGSLVETPAFIPYLSGHDNLRMLEILGGVHGPSRVDEVLWRVGLEAAARRRFKAYSLGMKQRLGIAAAMLEEPELIILDEPTNGLDPAGTREVRELIPALAADGHTIVLCSHLLHEVEQVCDYVTILHRGQVVRAGPIRELVLGRSGLEVRVDDPARAEAILRASRWGAGLNRRDGLLVIDAAGDEGAEVNRLLSQYDLYPSILRPVEHTLEDVFMEVTEGETDA